MSIWVSANFCTCCKSVLCPPVLFAKVCAHFSYHIGMKFGGTNIFLNASFFFFNSWSDKFNAELSLDCEWKRKSSKSVSNSSKALQKLFQNRFRVRYFKMFSFDTGILSSESHHHLLNSTALLLLCRLVCFVSDQAELIPDLNAKIWNHAFFLIFIFQLPQFRSLPLREIWRERFYFHFSPDWQHCIFITQMFILI